MRVVADTGPVNYLILSGHEDLLSRLYGQLIIPATVFRELLHPRAPASVRQWVNALPDWAKVESARSVSGFGELGPGEREALCLALELKADFLLIDETLGRQTAVRNGMAVKGTLGVLEEAADRKLVSLPDAIGKLRATGMFLSKEILQTVLDRHRKAKAG